MLFSLCATATSYNSQSRHSKADHTEAKSQASSHQTESKGHSEMKGVEDSKEQTFQHSFEKKTRKIEVENNKVISANHDIKSSHEASNQPISSRWKHSRKVHNIKDFTFNDQTRKKKKTSALEFALTSLFRQTVADLNISNHTFTIHSEWKNSSIMRRTYADQNQSIFITEFISNTNLADFNRKNLNKKIMGSKLVQLLKRIDPKRMQNVTKATEAIKTGIKIMKEKLDAEMTIVKRFLLQGITKALESIDELLQNWKDQVDNDSIYEFLHRLSLAYEVLYSYVEKSANT